MSCENCNCKGKNKKTICLIVVIIAALIVGVLFFALSSENKKSEDITTTAQEYISETTEITDSTTEKAVITTEENTETTEIVSESTVVGLTMTRELQTEMNTFFSNFSEIEFESFEDSPSEAALIYFAYSHILINQFDDAVELGEYSDIDENQGFNFRIKQENMKRVINRFFGITPGKEFGKTYEYYKDGYFYGEITGGQLGYGFSIVTNVDEAKKDLYEVSFDIYASECDAVYYQLMPDEIDDYISALEYPPIKIGNGHAKIKASDISDRDTYTLLYYDVGDTYSKYY